MKANDIYPSKFLKAEDLDGDKTMTIKSCAMEEFKDKEKGTVSEKLIVYFDEVDKGLLVNKTNFKTIADITKEDDTNNWIGKKITLTVIDVDAFGDVVAAIRVKKTVYDHATLVKQYQALFEQAKKKGLEPGADFIIEQNAGDDAIIEAGKQLRAMIDAAGAM
jgi:hypothetical protein